MRRKTATRADLASAVARKSGVSRAEATRLVATILDAVGKAIVEEGQVKIAGFGTFEVRDVAASKGWDFESRKSIDLQSGRKVRFQASEKVSQAVNEGPPAARRKARPAGDLRPGVLVGVRLQQREIGCLDMWRGLQPDTPSRTEAARRLLKAALDAL